MKTLRLIGCLLLACCRLNAQPVAILDDPTLPGYNADLLRALHRTVRDSGWETYPLSVAEAEKVWPNRGRYRALILPQCETVTPLLAECALNFVNEGGPTLFLGGPLLDRPLTQRDGKWMTREMEDAVLAAQPLHHTWTLSPDFPAGWRRTCDRNAPKESTVTFDPESRALLFTLGPLSGWDNFFAPTGTRLFAEGDDRFAFSAKAETPDAELSIEIIERDGSRWIASLKLQPEWRRYTLPPEAFRYWHDASTPSRGKPGDRLNPAAAERIGFGTSRTHTPTMAGRPLTVRIREVGSLKDPFAPTGKGDVTLRPQDGVYPRYKLTAIPLDGETCFAALCRTFGEGYGKVSPWRFIPIPNPLFDPATRFAASPEWLLLEGFPVHRLAGFGYSARAILSREGCLPKIAEALRILTEEPILYGAGTERFTYLAGEPIRIGAEVSLPPGWTPKPLSVTVSLYRDTPDGLRATNSGTGAPDELILTKRFTTETGNHVLMTLDPPLDVGEYRIRVTLDGAESPFGPGHRSITHSFAVISPDPDPQEAFIRVAEGNFILRGAPWYPVGVNYWPHIIAGMEPDDFRGGWMRDSCYAPSQVEADLDWMAQAGINLISIQAPRLEDARNLVDLLRRCRKRGIYVNLFHGAASPIGFKRRELADFIAAARLAGNAQLFAYDTIWEPGNHLFKDDTARARWDSEWRHWIDSRYGSAERAERDWGVPARRNGKGEIISPPDTWFREDGPWRIQMAAYRRFMDNLTSRLWNHATRELRELDPNHLISFRQGNTLPYDFALTGPVRHIDFICPEGYAIPDSEAGGDAIGWITRFVDATTGGKPVIWSEFGVSVWDAARMEPSPALIRRQGVYHERFYRAGLFAGANGTVPWWWPGGFRIGEASDYGIFDPNGTERPAFALIRRYAPAIRQPRAKPLPQRWVRFDRDAHAGGYWHEALGPGAKAFGEARRAGELLGVRLDGSGMTSADCPMTAVGNVPCDGTNPPKYLDAEFDTFTPLSETAGKRRFRAVFGNIGMAEWLPASAGTGGCRLTVRNPAGDLLAAAPLETRTPRLAAASFTFEIPATESTLLLRLEAQNRTPFGETKRVGENEKMSGR